MNGDRLKRVREAAGLSQDSLGKKAGVMQATISSFELGKRKPHPSTLRKLAVALGVAPEWLAGEGSEEGPDTASVLVAMIEGREARLQEAVDNDEIDLETARSADDLYRDIVEMVPSLRTGRERINLALDGLKAAVDTAYDAAVRRLTGRRASVETMDTHAKGGRTGREVRSA